MKRVVLIVLDSVGVGEMPDAKEYGDLGSNTILNIYKSIKGFKLENLERMGLGNIDGLNPKNGLDGLDVIQKSNGTMANYGKMMEKSKGKDTTTGHWEIAGIILDKAFPVYPDGFPDRIIDKFTGSINRGILGNCAASGTEIIKSLGDEHVKTGKPIIYTSADSVFQIAAHEDIIPVEELYHICKIARNILSGDDAVGRVIARPFTGEKGNYVRTKNRKDFSLELPVDTMLDLLIKNNFKVMGIGKIADIFSNRGITENTKSYGNMDGVDKLINIISTDFSGLIFLNLVDFDMLYGHRNDTEGYAKALKEFDVRIPEIITALREEDILIITADHGCDPTTKGTDHTREYVPLFVYGKKIRTGINLGIRESFSDIAKSVCEYLGVKSNYSGKSFIE